MRWGWECALLRRACVRALEVGLEGVHFLRGALEGLAAGERPTKRSCTATERTVLKAGSWKFHGMRGGETHEEGRLALPRRAHPLKREARRLASAPLAETRGHLAEQLVARQVARGRADPVAHLRLFVRGSNHPASQRTSGRGYTPSQRHTVEPRGKLGLSPEEWASLARS